MKELSPESPSRKSKFMSPTGASGEHSDSAPYSNGHETTSAGGRTPGGNIWTNARSLLDFKTASTPSHGLPGYSGEASASSVLYWNSDGKGDSPGISRGRDSYSLTDAANESMAVGASPNKSLSFSTTPLQSTGQPRRTGICCVCMFLSNYKRLTLYDGFVLQAGTMHRLPNLS